MEHRELQDLIPAHALDALEADDALQLETHIETCEACRRELDDMRETTALLAFATDPVEPPASLRAKILEAVAEPAPVRSRPRLRLAFLRGAFAGGLAVAAVALVVGVAVHEGSSRNPSAEVRVLTGTAQGAVVRDGSSSKLVLANLQSPATGHTYEAWLIGANGKPVPAGTFSGGGKTVVVNLKGDAGKAKTVAITVEPAGGSPTPTTAPFASASLA
ncbi:MAG: anti-sigma factor [Gaiellales bacterium]